MAKTIGIIALVAFIGGFAAMLMMGFAPASVVSRFILPLWGIEGGICDWGGYPSPCISWGTLGSSGWWGYPLGIALWGGLPTALGCLIWHKWDSLQAAERRFSAAQDAKRERRDAKRERRDAERAVWRREDEERVNEEIRKRREKAGGSGG